MSSQVAGESPLFPPDYESATAAQDAIEHVVHQTPRNFNLERTRWTLKLLRNTLPGLNLASDSALHRLLKRLNIRYKRGRDYTHSPDVDYVAKCDQIASYQARARRNPVAFPLYFLDELTYYRQPTLAHAYETIGHEQPLALRSYRSNTKTRIVGALNYVDGSVVYRQRSKISVSVLGDFWYDLALKHPTAQAIAVVVDNWPVHFHPDVLAPLQTQTFAFPTHNPSHWPTEPTRAAKHDHLPIRLLQLPTYAPWLNPIEKLWRYLYQEVLHLHQFSDLWDQLKQKITERLDQFALPSPFLLNYVGLLGV